jgi:hypothetical protein
MVAEFHIITESFCQNLSKEKIEEKTKALAQDFVLIKKYKETNKILIHSDIYNIKFISNFSISDLLFNNEIANGILDRDVRLSLKKIILESESTTVTSEEVKSVLLSEHSEDICHGLIAFDLINDVSPEFQVIYDIKGWLVFRRHFLSIYPKNESFFIDECSKYFPNIFFHERNKGSITSIFDCPKKIIYHLTALNDKFRLSQSENRNRTEVLIHFSSANDLDETASLEGNASRKPALSFDFKNIQDEIIQVCCEPHLKLCYNDFYPGDNSYSNDRRIYFHEGVDTIQNGKILVGHIGSHL